MPTIRKRIWSLDARHTGRIRVESNVLHDLGEILSRASTQPKPESWTHESTASKPTSASPLSLDSLGLQTTAAMSPAATWTTQSRPRRSKAFKRDADPSRLRAVHICYHDMLTNSVKACRSSAMPSPSKCLAHANRSSRNVWRVHELSSHPKPRLLLHVRPAA